MGDEWDLFLPGMKPLAPGRTKLLHVLWSVGNSEWWENYVLPWAGNGEGFIKMKLYEMNKDIKREADKVKVKKWRVF